MQYVFIVKLWVETREIPGAPGIPRCSAEILGKDTARSFQSFREMAEFMSRNAGNFPID